MLAYTVGRLLAAIVTFVGITVITFAVVHLAPGDPARGRVDDALEAGVSQRVYEQLRRHWGLDRPLYVQYGSWLRRLVTLDLGVSFSDQRSVWGKIRERMPWTLSLAGISLVLSLVCSMVIGVYSAAHSGGWFDKVTSTVLYGLYAVPSYVMAMLLLSAVVAWRLDWFAIRGAMSDDFAELSMWGQVADVFRHFVLITVCFAYPMVAYQSRFVRAQMLEALRQDYVRTARAKGLDERAVLWHAFRNTLVPLVTLVGLMVPALVSGSVILEVMFQWPGMGRLFFEAALQRDYPTVMALSAIGAVIVLCATLAADLTYAVVDPRIRYGR